MDKGIAVVGSLILDKHFVMDAYPRKSTLVKVSAGEQTIGGAGNLIIDLAKLDTQLKIKVSGIVGAGTDGRFMREGFAKYGNIDVSGIKDGGDTSLTLVMDAREDKTRTFFYFPGASDTFSYEDIDWEAIDADIFQLEYLLLLAKVDAADTEYGTVGAKILHEARKRGFLTSIDVVSETGPRAATVVPPALAYTDFCTINEIEASAVTGIPVLMDGVVHEGNMVKALKCLKDMGVARWVVIHCAQASYGLDCSSGRIFKVASLDIPRSRIKGTTGAGDAFCAGILYSAYKQKSLQEALQFASAVAGCSLFESNGTDGLRCVKEVMQVYAAYKGAEPYEEIKDQ
ncbi:MAG: carbohydrate kinase family protein [Spirochaetia bacterium]|jgi:sugar/nucleoside kinase (ribokinase family)|nr:carbohydrate kinase family protein [Spirochaetia bacterium]